MKQLLTLGAASLALGGCAGTADDAAPRNGSLTAEQSVGNTVVPAAPSDEGSARASLAAADGAARGSASFRQSRDGLSVQVQAEGVQPGTHGVHIHTVGKCDGPKFESAGPHWNPSSRQHGRDNPQGAHAGDLPNIEIGADGRGTLSFTVAGASMAQLFDADGAALLIHAKPDDYRTDPSGASGDRIACGVIQRN